LAWKIAIESYSVCVSVISTSVIAVVSQVEMTIRH